jgi:biotin synthase-like enzyme
LLLQLVQFFLNLFCLCSFHSRIYDTVSYQLESNQVNQIRHEDGDGHHISSSQQPKIRCISPFRLPCIFCKQKSYKKDRNLNRVESKDRVKNILHAANNKSDFDMFSLIQSVDNFVQNALYHSSCAVNFSSAFSLFAAWITSDTVIELLNIVLDLPCPHCYSTIMAFPK